MIRLKLLLGLFVAILFNISLAQAHEVTPSIATLKFGQDRSIALKISTNLEALLAKIGPEHEDTDDAPTAELYKELRNLSAADLTARLKEFTPEFLSKLGLAFEGKTPEFKVENSVIPDVGNIEQARESVISLVGQVPAGSSTFTWSFPAEYGTSVLRVERPDQEVQAQFFAAGATSEPFKVGVSEPRTWIAAAWDYMKIGYTHILPKGLDHILFVLGLFLLSIRLIPLLWQVTAFTLAHSVTLALGLYGVVNISPSIVEPLIALSIVYVAIENIMTNKLHAWRPVIVFAFGLLHGLGFAGILTEIGIPRSDFVLGLISFNVGVELGQLTVILLAWLAVGWAMKRDWYRARIAIPASLIIAAIGAYWFIERTFL
jgi:hypothetical protein